MLERVEMGAGVGVAGWGWGGAAMVLGVGEERGEVVRVVWREKAVVAAVVGRMMEEVGVGVVTAGQWD